MSRRRGRASRSGTIALTFAIVLTGAAVGWGAAYAGLGGWGLLGGLLLSAALVVWLSVRRPLHAGLIDGYAFSFLILTWRGCGSPSAASAT